VRGNRRRVGIHDVRDEHLIPARIHHGHHRRPGDQPHHFALRYHRKIILPGPIHQRQSARDGVGGRERGEFARHDFVHEDFAQQAAHSHHLLLPFRREEDERAEDDERRRHPLQTDQHKHNRQSLPDRRSDMRGPGVGQRQRQQRAQQPAAVHREGRDEVEKEQAQVQPCQDAH